MSGELLAKAQLLVTPANAESIIDLNVAWGKMSNIGPYGIAQDSLAVDSWRLSAEGNRAEVQDFLSCYRLRVIYMQRYKLLDTNRLGLCGVAGPTSGLGDKPWVIERGCPLAVCLVLEDEARFASLKAGGFSVSVAFELYGSVLGQPRRHVGGHTCSICDSRAVCSKETEPRCAAHVDTEVTKLSRQVVEFHKAFKLPTATRPTHLSDERVRLRLRLIAEEFFEALGACVEFAPSGIADAQQAVEFVIATSDLKIDMPELIDALADIDYVVEGTRLEFGINGTPIADEVHRSNMSKVGGEIRSDGKKMKGPNWTPPDIAGELRKQGWEGSAK
jgi:predicted HAD superfamily Cof-like phosphohydrolase